MSKNMKFLLLPIFLLFSLYLNADTNCESMDSGRSEYYLICEDSSLQQQLNQLVTKVNANTDFIIKWRLDEYNSPKQKSDLEKISSLVSKANEAIKVLADIYCQTEMAPGTEIATGSQSENREICIRDEEIKQKILLYKKFAKYTYVVKPSFSCGESLTIVEKEICGSHNLATLDVDISTYYSKISGIESEKQYQKDWLKTVRNACSKKVEVANCLKEVMQVRLKELTE